jgi:acyl dehydratase
MATPWLPGLAVRAVTAAVGAVLLQLKTIRVIAPVLLGDVVPVLALLASQRDLGPDIGGSHWGVPFFVWMRT